MKRDRAEYMRDFLDKAIETIPRSVGEKIALFQQHGITGRTRCPETCLVANYLTKMLPLEGTETVTVAITDVHVDDQWVDDDSSYTADAQLPPHVASFIHAFDKGAFPQLVENPWGPVSE